MASASVTAALRIRNVVHIGSPSQIVAVAAYLHNLAIEFYVQKQNSTAAAATSATAAAKFVFSLLVHTSNGMWIYPFAFYLLIK